VEHARGVRRGERGEQLLSDPRDAGRGQRSLRGQDLVERPGRDELHDDPEAMVMLGHVVDGHDAPVIEPGRRLGLALGPLVELGQLGLVDPGGQHDLLDRHLPVKELVVSPPHHAHAALADGLLEEVPACDNPPCGRRHSRTISNPPERARSPRRA